MSDDLTRRQLVQRAALAACAPALAIPVTPTCALPHAPAPPFPLQDHRGPDGVHLASRGDDAQLARPPEEVLGDFRHGRGDYALADRQEKPRWRESWCAIAPLITRGSRQWSRKREASA